MLRFAMLSGTALLGSALSAQDPRTVDHVFPATSWASVRFEGLNACRSAAEQLGLVKLGHDTLRRLPNEFVDQHLGSAMGKVSHALAEMAREGLRPAALRAVLRSPMGFAVGRPTFFGDSMLPSMALAVDTTGCAAEAEELREVLWSRLIAQGPKLSGAQETIDGQQVMTLTPEKESGMLLASRVGRWLIVTNSRGFLTECLATCQGKQASLASDRDYQSSLAQLGGSALVSAWVRVAPIGAALEPFLPYEAKDLAQAIGIESVRGLALTLGTGGGGSRGALHVALQPAAGGLAKSLFGRPASLSALALCPEDTGLLATMSVDTQGAVAACHQFFKALPMEARRELHRELSREFGHGGLPPEQLARIAQLFGPEITLAVTTPAKGSFQPEIVAIVDVTDAAAVEQLMLRAVGERLELAETSYEGTTIRYTNALKRDHVPYSPAIAFAGNRLVLGGSVQSVKAALSRAAGKRGGLQPTADFAAQLERAKGAAGIVSLRLKDAAGHLWGMARPMLAAQIKQLDGPDPELLPTAEDVQAAMSDCLLTLTLDQKGLTLREEQPLGLGAMVAAGGLLLDHALGMTPSLAEPARPAPAQVKAGAKKPGKIY